MRRAALSLDERYSSRHEPGLWGYLGALESFRAIQRFRVAQSHSESLAVNIEVPPPPPPPFCQCTSALAQTTRMHGTSPTVGRSRGPEAKQVLTDRPPPPGSADQRGCRERTPTPAPTLGCTNLCYIGTTHSQITSSHEGLSRPGSRNGNLCWRTALFMLRIEVSLTTREQYTSG